MEVKMYFWYSQVSVITIEVYGGSLLQFKVAKSQRDFEEKEVGKNCGNFLSVFGI